MNKKGIPFKLSAQFTIVSLIAVFIAACLFLIINSIGTHMLQIKMQNTDYIEQCINDKVEEFQSYITDNDIRSDDFESINAWVTGESNVTLVIYDNGKAIFDSTVSWRQNHGIEDGPPPNNYRKLYSVSFADKDVEVELFMLIEFKFRALITNIAIVISLLTFIMILTTFIRHKVKYITLLEKEVNILEGGDLNYRLTVKGNDEFTYLAKSIDNMRASIIERQKEEEQARDANHKLVTAMSHDLRTPLTILIGLLEIIDGKKYSNEQELETYITKSKNKAYQIKELSDQIFEYFFAFDMKESELNREYYGIDVINTMIEDYIFSLSEKGYIFEYDHCEGEAKVYIDVKVFGRVFSNIFSNILKYADKDKPVIINSKIDSGFLKIEVSNTVLEKKHKEESTNIGIEVCKNILQQHNGEFFCTNDGKTFSVFIRLKLIN